MEEVNKEKSVMMMYFEREFDIATKQSKGELCIAPFKGAIKGIIEVFDNQGLSGGSAPGYINAISSAIKNTLSFSLLSPLTGTDDEFNTDENSRCGDSFQSNRLGSVFREAESKKAYYLDAIIFQGEDDYDTFDGGVEGVTSRQYIRFPFMPKTFYINVKKEYNKLRWFNENNIDYHEERNDQGGKEYYRYLIKDRTQLDEVFKYYDKYDKTLNKTKF